MARGFGCSSLVPHRLQTSLSGMPSLWWPRPVHPFATNFSTTTLSGGQRGAPPAPTNPPSHRAWYSPAPPSPRTNRKGRSSLPCFTVLALHFLGCPSAYTISGCPDNQHLHHDETHRLFRRP